MTDHSAEEALLAVSQMQRTALTIIAKPWEHPLVKAWAQQFTNDPKLANEVLTGRCEWDAGISTRDLDALGFEADDAAFDLQNANPDWRWGRKPRIATRIYKLHAAAIAFCNLLADREQDERIARWQVEDNSCAERPYLQSEFI
jgi:hypothetical protein